MLDHIIDFLRGNLETTGYFQHIFPLVDFIPKGEDSYKPAEYTGKGQYKDVTKFDNYNGMAYFRRKGSLKVQKLEPENAVPCDMTVQVDFPLRLVACVPKDKLTKDDQFADDRIAQTILKAITGEGGTVISHLKAKSVSFIPSEITIDNKTVLDEEYPGFKFKDINFRFSYLAIDFNVSVIIKQSCIPTECEIYDYCN